MEYFVIGLRIHFRIWQSHYICNFSGQADAAARSPALRPYSSAEPQCRAPFNSEWPMLMRP
jgi:hypothetical protein